MNGEQIPPVEGELLGSPADGWFKIVRAFFDHPLWVDCPDSWMRIWLVLLGHANWAARKRYFNRAEIELQPGELLCSLAWLAKKARVSVKQTRSALKYLEAAQSVASEKTHRGTRITIVNWKGYRQDESSTGQAEGHSEGHTEGTLRAQSGHTEGTTRRSKEVKKESTPTPKTFPGIANTDDSGADSDPVPLSNIPPLPADESGFPVPPKMTCPWTPPEQRRAIAQIGWTGVRNITDAQESWIVGLNPNALTSLPDDPHSLFSIHHRLVCFRSFWSLYPRHEDPRDARYAFLTRCQTPDDAEAAVEYLATVGVEEIKAKSSSPKYWKYPATWINARPWEKKPAPKREAEEVPLFANEQNA